MVLVVRSTVSLLKTNVWPDHVLSGAVSPHKLYQNSSSNKMGCMFKRKSCLYDEIAGSKFGVTVNYTS